MATKVKRTAYDIRTLGNTTRGIRPKLLQQATQVFLLPQLCYGAEACWPGLTRPGKTKLISNQ